MFVSGTGAVAPIPLSRGEGAPSAHTGGGSGMREEMMEEVR